MKRQSPMPPGPMKRPREEGHAGTPGAQGPQAPSMDPDQLSDAIISAGVDLREEENLLSSSVHAGAPGTRFATPVDSSQLFLDANNLWAAMDRACASEGVRPSLIERPELLGIVSAATAEWIAEIVTQAALISRHRRLSRNEQVSSTSKALRTIAQQDKEAEQRREALKLSMGIGAPPSDSKGDSEEIQHRAANDTAAMMTSGRKRYSWLSGGSGAGARPLAGNRSRGSESTRVKEIREDPGIALRDVLNAMEQKHMGVRKSLVKGYARIRD